MFIRLLLLFTLVPLTELYLLVVLGGRFGVLPTFLLVIFTGALGAWLAREQGVRTWRRAQQQLAAGTLPADELLNGILLLIAGAVLLTPGLLTDILGFVLLIPATRRPITAAVSRRLEKRMGPVSTRGRVVVVESRPVYSEDDENSLSLPPGELD